jgi:predicted permease
MQTTLTYLTVAFVVLGMIILGATLPWFYRRLQKRLDAAEAYFKNPSAR